MSSHKINIHHINFSFIWLLGFGLFASNQYCFSQSESKNELRQSIRGKLQLDSIWEPVVYLSHIRTFNDMYTMSNQIIIAETKVDSIGRFHFSTEAFPKEDNLYRIHLSKKEAPAASLIIGGKEENHMFLIANRNSSISISNTSKNRLFFDCKIEGSQPNVDFQIIHGMVNGDFQNEPENNLRKAFINKTVYDNLRHVADTASHPIVSLYALMNSEFETTYLEHKHFYEDYLEKWKGENSRYFKELRTKFPEEPSNSKLWILVSAAFFFVLGYIINQLFSTKRKQVNTHLKALSVQEQKVYVLLEGGKSNKEISEELNIGISTTKSHVSSIYSKLNVKSRKDIVNLNKL